MEIFYTSDMHFGHVRICELANRPFDSVDEMNQAMIDNWNGLVRENDYVIVTGDACMGQIAESLSLINRLNGSKILVLGNHDRPHPSNNKKEAKRAHWHAEYSKYFDHIGMEYDATIADVPVRYCHFPVTGDSHDEDRFVEYRPEIPDGGWLIHGHVHEAWRVNGRQINVGVDVWDFAPVHIDTIAEIIKGEK